ncbi:MAG: LacI family DNA-binding transcriptional regulator [Spirochaetaceae bacterium]|jgi:LacI family transcriptional regulator|nr:LacI family DNA-binding transcriptional regulator [Spirochaetaceae bacterium]
MDIIIDNQSNEPPFRQIAAQLKSGISENIYPPGILLPSVRDIVKRTGVSLTTVQKAFSLLQQENLIFSSPGKGNYVADTNKSFNNRIYVFLPSSSLSFFMKILSGMTEQANRFGYEIILNSLNTDKLNWNQNTIDSLYKAKKEGAAVIFIEEAFGEVKKICMDVAGYVPFVTIEWVLERASSIVNNYSESVFTAFYKINDKNTINSLLILKGRDYQHNAMEKMKGFNRVIDERKWLVERDVFFRNSDFDAISGYEVVKDFFENASVDCVFCANDYEAIGAIGALTEKGLLVGKDVRVIGYGDMVDKVTSYFPVTTISQNLEEIGKKSVQAVKEILEGKEKKMHIVSALYVPGRT